MKKEAGAADGHSRFFLYQFELNKDKKKIRVQQRSEEPFAFGVV
jgi:hypothetical protein